MFRSVNRQREHTDLFLLVINHNGPLNADGAARHIGDPQPELIDPIEEQRRIERTQHSTDWRPPAREGAEGSRRQPGGSPG